MSYLVVLLLPSSRSSASMVMADAGQIASHSLQAMHLSSPVGYLRRACSPRKRGEIGPFSKGYKIVYLQAMSDNRRCGNIARYLRRPEILLQYNIHASEDLCEHEVIAGLVYCAWPFSVCFWPG